MRFYGMSASHGTNCSCAVRRLWDANPGPSLAPNHPAGFASFCPERPQRSRPARGRLHVRLHLWWRLQRAAERERGTVLLAEGRRSDAYSAFARALTVTPAMARRMCTMCSYE